MDALLEEQRGVGCYRLVMKPASVEKGSWPFRKATPADGTSRAADAHMNKSASDSTCRRTQVDQVTAVSICRPSVNRLWPAAWWSPRFRFPIAASSMDLLRKPSPPL